MRPILLVAMLAAAALAGCAGSNGVPEPGADVKETGRTIHLRMWVVDLEQADIYPGLKANLWAFCAEPAKPDDSVSRAAIEYRDQSGTVPAGSEGKCSVPGPTIRVQQGDRVIVDFENTHVHNHVIHWHGQLVPYESDGTPGVNQDSVKPGDTYRYEFVAKKAGTLWYHCHVDTQFHVMQGLYGGFIVEPQDQKREPKADRDYLLVLGTAKRSLIESTPPAPGQAVDPHAKHKAGASCGVTGQQGCQNPPMDVTPDVFLINGKSAPLTESDPLSLLKAKEGEKVRLRFLNAGTTMETIHLHGHDMLVTHRDGTPLASPMWVDTLTIGPGERYDLTFTANNPGVWILHTHVNDHETNCGASPGGMETLLVYAGYEDKLGSYKAELPAGCPNQEKVELPPDVLRSFSGELRPTPPETTASVEWTVPLEGCAVRNLQVTVRARAESLALQPLNDLRLDVLLPDGSKLAEAPIGAATFTAWNATYPKTGVDLPTGDYRLRVSGRAILATVDLDFYGDYYESVDLLTEAGGSCAHAH